MKGLRLGGLGFKTLSVGMCLKLWVPPSIFLPELGFCNIPEQSSADDDYDDDDDCTDYHGGGRDDDSGGGDGDGEGDYGCEMVMKMLLLVVRVKIFMLTRTPRAKQTFTMATTQPQTLNRLWKARSALFRPANTAAISSIWEFPKIGDPNVVPQIVGSLL